MEIHIDRYGKRMGPYSIEEASELLLKQTLRDTDIAWREGMAEWEPLPSLLASIHPTLTAAQTAPPEVETYGDLRKPKDPDDPTAVFVPAGPGKGETYGELSKPKINPFAILYEMSLRVLLNVWGFVFLLLFFGAHRPVINFGSSWLAGDVEGHWWGENTWVGGAEEDIKNLKKDLLLEKDSERKKELQDEIYSWERAIDNANSYGAMTIRIYSFNSTSRSKAYSGTHEFSVTKFTRRGTEDKIKDTQELEKEGSYTTRGNKIIYMMKGESADTNRKSEERIWYYKVSDGGMRLTLSGSSDFLDPIILENAVNQFPY